jgi:hypothetical protein
MEEILQQAPAGITHEYIETIYAKHEGNIPNILAELWNVEEPQKQNKNESIEDMERKNKFAEVRDICDAFDAEMEKQMNILRQQSLQQNIITS